MPDDRVGAVRPNGGAAPVTVAGAPVFSHEARPKPNMDAKSPPGQRTRALRRLLRADGVSCPGLLDSLARHGSTAEARCAYVAFLRSLGRADSPSGAPRLDRHLRGAPDPELARLEALGVPLGDLLGLHDSVLALAAKTVRACFAHDLRDRPARLAALATAPDVALDLLVSAGPAAVSEAQACLVAHPRADRLVHLGHVWRGPLSPLRRAYMEALAKWADLSEAESVVGHAEAESSGDPERRAALLDAEELARGEAGIPVLCGLRLPATADRPASACFSALELLERDVSIFTTSTPDWAPEVQVEPTTDWVAEPAVDRLLTILERALLPGRASVGEPVVDDVPGVDVADDVAEEVARRAGALLPPSCSAREVRSLLAQALRAADGDGGAELVPAATAARQGGSDPAAWSRLLHTWLLQRWVRGVWALLDELAPACKRLTFRGFLGRWLREGPPVAPPVTRYRRGEGPAEADLPPPAFALDPVGSHSDAHLLRLVVTCTKYPSSAVTWGVNEWDAARETLRLVAAGTGHDVQHRQGLVWIHNRWLDRVARQINAFKKEVSLHGVWAWCASEVDEALAAVRPPGVNPREWRARCAARVGRLDEREWRTDAVWKDGRRTLAWIAERLASGGGS